MYAYGKIWICPLLEFPSFYYSLNNSFQTHHYSQVVMHKTKMKNGEPTYSNRRQCSVAPGVNQQLTTLCTWS